ncbi:alpha/beta hydrolase fold domain-containing protein [Pseudomonas sp. M30-35]|uniref:flavin-containing monooxygenase n=1 Tax=Pseudomonas sp. M30-35 TaxID=1981174 RepID=UPI000B3CEA23|nr:alpha/beta hydrolase fold domain-containing protein [Pseudomonas sp. M30-35]ARU88146.1 4-hydroxyacetophenone monooxygenase [Pseudomonas sp. M30-35]
MNKKPEACTDVRVIIIGTGFAGLGLAIQLQKAGIDRFLLLEKAEDVGGTWRDNSYPGAACDVPSHLYSFSFEPKLDWTRKFAPQAEIHSYMQHCADKYQLRPHIRFNSEVASATYEAEHSQWRVTLVSGEQFVAPILVSACGQLNQPAYPSIPGRDSFAGEAFHSARWRHDIDLTGKRIAVIGTGASAIQFVPQIQVNAAHLTLFQRSAAYVISKPDRAYRPWELAVMRRFGWLQKIDRGLKYIQHESRALAFVSFPLLLKAGRFSFKRALARGISDKQLRSQLEPDYPIGCKRILISNDYYPALSQANVSVVSQRIKQISNDAVITEDGVAHPCDVLIYGTGFMATDFLSPMAITGLEGLDLNQVWREGAEAYKGISVSGFPNLFLLYGPNTNLGHNSIIYMLESQFRYVLGCIEALDRYSLTALDVKPDVQRQFNNKIQRAIHHTVWAQGCTSWYQTASGKHTNNWPGYTFNYRRITRAPELQDYQTIPVRFTPPADAQPVLRTVLRGGLRVLFRGIVRPPVPVALQRWLVTALAAVHWVETDGSRTKGKIAGRSCEWYKPSQESDGVILYLHGGAYVIGGANTHRAICKTLMSKAQVQLCALNYRLAPEHPFPAARDDAVAAYQALLEQGFAPSKIIIAGDSAGGNLALLTALHLRHLGLALPRALVCLSPLTDFSLAQLHKPEGGDPMLSQAWMEQSRRDFLSAQIAPQDPAVSPVFADLSGLPPILIQVAEQELLLNDSLRFEQRAKEAGVDVRLELYPGVWHVFQAHAGLLKASDYALARVVSFIREQGLI